MYSTSHGCFVFVARDIWASVRDSFKTVTMGTRHKRQETKPGVVAHLSIGHDWSGTGDCSVGTQLLSEEVLSFGWKYRMVDWLTLAYDYLYRS